MKEISKAIGVGMAGLAGSAALLALALMATIVVAVARDGRAEIPGVFEVWMERYQGSPALNLLPHEAGMGIVVVVLTAAYVAVSYGAGGVRSRREGER